MSSLDLLTGHLCPATLPPWGAFIQGTSDSHSNWEGSPAERRKRKKFNLWQHIVKSHPNRASIEGIWIHSQKPLFPSYSVKFVPGWIPHLPSTPAGHLCCSADRRSMCLGHTFPAIFFIPLYWFTHHPGNLRSPVPPLTTTETQSRDRRNGTRAPSCRPWERSPCTNEEAHPLALSFPMEKHTQGVVSGKDRIFLLGRAFIVPKWTLLLTSPVLNTRHTVQTLKKKKKKSQENN